MIWKENIRKGWLRRSEGREEGTMEAANLLWRQNHLAKVSLLCYSYLHETSIPARAGMYWMGGAIENGEIP